MNRDQVAPSDVGAARERIPRIGGLIVWTCFAIVMASWFSSPFGVRGFLPNYAGDLFGALMLYSGFRQETKWPRLVSVFSPRFTAVFVFAGCTAAEFAQLRNWLTGTFDPIDLGYYAIGVAIGLILDRWIVPAAKAVASDRGHEVGGIKL